MKKFSSLLSRLPCAVVLLITLAGAGISPVHAGKDVTIAFDGGEGKPRIVPAPNGVPFQGTDLDGWTPVAGGRIFSLAPNDLVRLSLDGPSIFRGKTLAMKANAVTITYEEHGFIFTSTERKHHPHIIPHSRPKQLRVGSEVRVIVKIVPKDGSAGRTLDLSAANPVDFRLDKPSWVELAPLVVDPGSVAWQNRTALTPAEKHEYNAWLESLRVKWRRVPGFDKVHGLGATVQPGDLRRLRIKLTAER